MNKIYLISILLLGLNGPVFGQLPGTPYFFTTANDPPTVTTAAVTSIATTSATSGGSYPSDNGYTITGRGVAWNTAGTPTTSNSTNSDTGSGSPYSFAMNGLNVNTTYYVRAYLITSGDTIYGNQVSFNTQDNPPAVSTDGATNITGTSATSGGSYPSANGYSITGRGVCWNTAGTPDVNSSKNGDSGSGSPYSFAMNGLSGNTLYYIRAYLITSGGTFYGNQVSFTTTRLCGAFVSAGVFKAFMCYNLGATDTSADPNIPIQSIHGNYYQWGIKTGVANASTQYGAINGWNTTIAADGAWTDGGKTGNDPCSSGFRVPTSNEWYGVLTNNTVSRTGSWTSNGGNFSTAISFGPDVNIKTLTLPAAGFRRANDGTLFYRGGNGFYWSSTESSTTGGYFLGFDGSGGGSGAGANRTTGMPVRCISE